MTTELRWREIYPPHPAAEVFPMLEGAEMDALVADIREHGVMFAVRIYWDDGRWWTLDGRNRLEAAERAGLHIGGRNDPGDVPLLFGDPEIADPVAFVISANIHRRHLTPEQKRDTIRRLLMLNPSLSNRQIAREVGVGHPTVARIRREAEQAGDVEQRSTRIDSLGRQQPASKPTTMPDQWRVVMTDDLRAARARRAQRFAVNLAGTGTSAKPILPDMPRRDDPGEQCAWMTAVFHLSAAHPITGGAHSGLKGERGHVRFARLGAPDLEFKPASRLSRGKTLADSLLWQLIREDDEPFSWTDRQARTIARVAAWLCDASAAITSREETARLVRTYIDGSEEIDGNSFGGTAERYEIAVRLRAYQAEHGRPVKTKFLAEQHDDELLLSIRVSDLQALTRRLHGSTVERGWLDGQMEEFGWERVPLQGQSTGGRQGRVDGRHARCDVYRGPLSSVYPPDDEPPGA